MNQKNVNPPKSIFAKTKMSVIALMIAVLSHLPNVAMAEVVIERQQELLPTQEALTELTRTQAEQRIGQYMQNQELREKLMSHGYSPTEIQARINSLSNSELNSLVQQMDQAQYGGDILITILLIILIIFLVKRI